MHKDLTPIIFSISAIIFIFGMLRFNLFMVIPFARNYIFEQMKDGILVFDSNKRLLEANPRARRLLHLTREDIGKTLDNLSVMSVALQKLTEAGFNSIELSLDISGEERIFELDTKQLEDSKKYQIGLLVILNDITERKQMQEQIIARDRLASIGELTEGVAHEINNPRAIIKGTSELLMQQDLTEDVKQDIESINNEVDRASGIVENLAIFAQRGSSEKRPLTINEVISNTLKLHTSKQGTNSITTKTHFSYDLPTISGNEHQLIQVFLNLIANAEYSMIEANGKGQITITTEEAGGFLHIRISDDGPGIPKENINRIFNPFFTTRDFGKGSGLGLSICHGIVVEHGGNIWAESSYGNGSTFVVELPVLREA
jgi:PAS domain S-box-containing protein